MQRSEYDFDVVTGPSAPPPPATSPSGLDAPPTDATRGNQSAEAPRHEPPQG